MNIKLNKIDFHKLVIEDGIKAAKEEFHDGNPHQTSMEKQKLKGCLEGFTIAKDILEAADLNVKLQELHIKMRDAMRNRDDNFWIYRGQEIEVAWVMGCMAAYDFLTGATPAVAPGRKNMVQAERLLGLRASNDKGAY